MIGDFLAIMPVEQSAAVRDFANETMLAFEPFRAPLVGADRARRLEIGPHRAAGASTWTATAIPMCSSISSST